MPTLAEQETTVTQNREDSLAYFYTADPVIVRRIRADSRFLITKDRGEALWATIPSDQWDPTKGLKARRRPLTPEQREAAAARLAQVRASR